MRTESIHKPEEHRLGKVEDSEEYACRNQQTDSQRKRAANLQPILNARIVDALSNPSTNLA